VFLRHQRWNSNPPFLLSACSRGLRGKNPYCDTLTSAPCLLRRLNNPPMRCGSASYPRSRGPSFGPQTFHTSQFLGKIVADLFPEALVSTNWARTDMELWRVFPDGHYFSRNLAMVFIFPTKEIRVQVLNLVTSESVTPTRKRLRDHLKYCLTRGHARGRMRSTVVRRRIWPPVNACASRVGPLPHAIVLFEASVIDVPLFHAFRPPIAIHGSGVCFCCKRPPSLALTLFRSSEQSIPTHRILLLAFGGSLHEHDSSFFPGPACPLTRRRKDSVLALESIQEELP